MGSPTDTYLALLARWNRTINLTALHVDPPDDAAMERLIHEPTRAASLIPKDALLAVDLGSGGGSPAIPLKIACPWLAFVLVESRTRKCAFLREAVRQLGLVDVTVVHEVFEDLADERRDLAGAADVVTFRAVRADEPFWSVVLWLLNPTGRALWFGGQESHVPAGLRHRRTSGSTLLLTRSTDPL